MKLNNQKLATIAGLLSIGGAIAATTSSATTSPATMIKVNGSIPVAKAMPAQVATSVTASEVFNIPAGAPVTAALMDKCWDNRENLNNQKIIAAYLMTKPAIPSDYEAAWKLSRMVYFIGNFGIGETQFVSTSAGVKLFRYGADAGEVAKKLNPNAVEGYFWYAVDLGSYGLANGIVASASNAGSGMDALRKAKSIDDSYQGYGSSRILGRYYQELPGIFGGSSSKAQELLTYAVQKAPEYRKNWAFLGNFYLSQKAYANAMKACSKAISLSPQEGKYEEIRYLHEAKECVAKAKAGLSS